jgi:hypothetical protein
MDDQVGRGKRSKLAATVALAAGVVCSLALIDYYLLGVFVPNVIMPRYAPEGLRLADRTANKNLSVLFEATAERLAEHERIVTVVGDSTVMAFREPEDRSLTAELARIVAKQPGAQRKVAVAEYSALGLPTEEALVLISKALALGVDLVVYAVTPRVICHMNERVSDVTNYVMEFGVARQIGAKSLVELYPPGQLASSLVYSHWGLLRYRREINARLVPWVAETFGVTMPLPTPLAYTVGKPPHITNAGPLWTRADCGLDESNSRVRALVRIADVCRASGRCLIYSGPINQQSAERFEGGLIRDFSVFARELFQGRNVPFRNYTNAIMSSGFLPSPQGGPDAIHLNVNGRARLNSFLAPEVLRALERSSAA